MSYLAEHLHAYHPNKILYLLARQAEKDQPLVLHVIVWFLMVLSCCLPILLYSLGFIPFQGGMFCLQVE